MQDVGVEVRAAQFTRYGRYALAIITDVGLEKHVFLSEEAPPSCSPTWDVSGVRVHIPAGQKPYDLELQFFCDQERLPDHHALLRHDSACCSCQISITDADLRSVAVAEQARSLSLLVPAGESWQSLGSVTLVLRQPCHCDIALIPIKELPPIKDQVQFTVAEQRIRIKGMAKRKKEYIQGVMQRLDHMQKALNALDRQAQDLQSQRIHLVDANKALERRLQEIVEPYLSDLDVEVCLSLPEGQGKVLQLIAGAEARWLRERENVIAKWGEFQQVQNKVQHARHLQHRLRTIERARTDQQNAMIQVKTKHKELTKLWEAMSYRQRLIHQLEGRVEETMHLRGVPSEAALEVSRERSARDALTEAASQLEILLRNSQTPTGRMRGEVNRKLRKRSERISQLVDEIEHLRASPRRNEGGRQVNQEEMKACKRDISDLNEAILTLQHRDHDLCQEADALERTCQAHATTFTRDLAQLKIKVAEIGARASQLEAELASS